MSDIAEEEVGEIPEEAVEDLDSAIEKVLKNALISDGLVRGLHEVAAALDSGRGKICFLAQSCNEPGYTKLIEALAAEKQIPLVKVEQAKKLGQWAGLCKIDREGQPRKIVGASSVCITDWGEDSGAKAFLENYLTQNQ
eukprot:Platyproteum_vivax@DN6944_c0_g1_i2.p1